MAKILIKCTSGNVSGQAKVEAVVPGIVTFHIYHDGRIEKHIPKLIKQGYEQKYKYVYHGVDINVDDTKNNKDIEIDVCILSVSKVDKRGNGKSIETIPDDAKFLYNYPDGGDAEKAYIDKKGTIYVSGKKYGNRSYPKVDEKIELVRMPDSLNILKDNVIIKMSYHNTQRRYCNPETMAAFIGVMATIGKEIICTGMCFADATSYPSLSHPNGDSADTEYFSSFEDEQRKVSAFIRFHFTKIFRGKKSWYPKLEGTKFAPHHETHLHAGDFNTSIVTIKKL